MMNHQFIVITSLPFVHTARRTYRLNGPVKSSDLRDAGFIFGVFSKSCLNLII